MAGRWTWKLVRWSMRDLSGANEMAVWVRRFAARSPRRREHVLTSVLLLLAQRQIDADRLDDALATLTEVVRLCRHRRDEEFEPNLAVALYNQSVVYAELGSWEHAQSAAEQAVETYRRLMSRDRNRFEPDYADALDRLGVCLSECGRLEEAVPVAEHAVRIGRRLAVDTPEERRPDLARCVRHLGVYLIDTGRFEEGLHATEEAVRLYRRLVQDRPGQYETDLADSVRNRDMCLTTWTVHVVSQAAPDEVVLGPYPLCEACKRVNGGLVAVWHRQVHVRAHGKEACVDEGLAEIMAGLWAVCDTTSCCEDDDGRAYVSPAAGQALAAEEFLSGLGIRAANEGGALYFALPSSARGQ